MERLRRAGEKNYQCPIYFIRTHRSEFAAECNSTKGQSASLMFNRDGQAVGHYLGTKLIKKKKLFRDKEEVTLSVITLFNKETESRIKDLRKNPVVNTLPEALRRSETEKNI